MKSQILLPSALVALMTLPSFGAGALNSQVRSATPPAAAYPDAAAVPFGPGEKTVYNVKYGIAGTVGEASLSVPQLAEIRGQPVYLIDFRMKASALFGALKVNDHFQSWFDVRRLHSHRYHQDVHEVNYKRVRTVDFFTDRGIWEQRQEGKEMLVGELPTDLPLDDISFLYFVRTVPLEVGRTYTFRRYWKEDGNPVTLEVLRRERVKVEAGEFDTIVVRPIIQTDGMFSEGGKAEIYFSDDERRLVVQLKTKFGPASVDLQLKSYTPGQPLTGR
ncbi:MAG: DUF3108 domain-containing protein [Gemmatimonadota bacterium]